MHRLRSLLSALKPTRLGVLFAVLIGVGVGFWQWGRPPQPRVVLENLGVAGQAYFSPDGQTPALIHQEFTNRQYCLTLCDVNAGLRKHELLRGSDLSRVVFSSDGRKVACLSGPQTCHIWDPLSGRELEKHHLKEWQIDSLIFSPHGRLLALGHNEIFTGGGFWADYLLLDVQEHKVVKKLGLHAEGVIARGNNTILAPGKRGVKVVDLATDTEIAERADIPNVIPVFSIIELSLDRRFLMELEDRSSRVVFYDLRTGEKHEFTSPSWDLVGATIAPDGQTVALGILENSKAPPKQKSWWTRIMDWLGTNGNARDDMLVSLKTLPGGDEIISLNGCSYPLISADGETLAVIGPDGSLQLWDLPIRKPIGKILGLAGVAAVATLLAINGLGWLRRRKCSGQPVDSRADQSSPGTDHDRLEHQAQ